MWIAWLIVILILTIIEISTTNLVSIWFVASAILALIISLFTDTFIIQFATFVLGGTLLLILTKVLIKNKLINPNAKTNFDRIIGTTGKVTQKITNESIGEVYVDGKKWSAVASEEILENEKVKILAIEGVKLKVEKEK